MKKALTCAFAVVVLVGAWAPASSAAVDKYWNGNFCCYQQHYNTTHNYWTNNEMWRPVGYTVESWYYNGSQPKSGDAIDTFSNPFYNYGPYGYSIGYCYDYADNSYTATCQIIT
jgi:hypothetical protein